MVAKVHNETKESFLDFDETVQNKDVWAGLGLGSDLAAALEGKKRS